MRRNGRCGFAAWPLAVALAGVAGGCADIVAPATRSAVDSGLGTLTQAQNRREIEQILRSDEITRATRSLTRAALDEILSGGGPDSDARLAKLSSDFARDIGPALGQALDDVVLPRVQAAIARSVHASLDEMLAEGNRQRIGAFTADVANQAIARVGPQMEATVTRGIVNAVERILQKDLSPAIGKALADNTPALAHATRAMTAAALDGVNDAMAGPFGDMFRKERAATIAQVQAAEAQQQRVLVDEIDRQVTQSRHWFETLLVLFAVVGVAMLVLGVAMLRLLVEHRRLRARLAA